MNSHLKRRLLGLFFIIYLLYAASPVSVACDRRVGAVCSPVAPLPVSVNVLYWQFICSEFSRKINIYSIALCKQKRAIAGFRTAGPFIESGWMPGGDSRGGWSSGMKRLGLRRVAGPNFFSVHPCYCPHPIHSPPLA